MATPIPPDIRVRIYQLEENPGGTDLQKKSSPAPVEYTSTGVSNDFDLISISDIRETIEIDKGVYLIDSMSIVVDGLSDTFFIGYGDPLNEPYVCEIYDNNDSEVIFHGPIERHSVHHDARSQYTSFDILSWTYVLEQTSAAARSVYETKMKENFESTGGEFDTTKITIPGTSDDGDSMVGRIVAGDIAVFESTIGEYRGVITEIISETAATIELRILGEPNVSIIRNEVIPAINCIRYTPDGHDFLRIEVTNATFVGFIKGLENDSIQQGAEISLVSKVVALSITYSAGLGEQPLKLILFNDLELNRFSFAAVVIADDRESVFLYFGASEDRIADAVANGVTINQAFVPSEVKKGTKVRILGKGVYGYSPSGFFGVGEGYLVTEVIEGMFSLAETGIFQYVADTFTYPTGFTSRRWNRWFEWPANLIKSLRLMQNTEMSFLKIVPTLDGGDLPRMTVVLIDRREINPTELGAATAITGIIDYSEDSADLTPRGVTITPHIKYNMPNVFKIYDTWGFWYGDNTLTDDAKTTVPPEGSDTIEFKVQATPDWFNGKLWVGNKKGIYHPDNYRSIARMFYNFYNDLSQKCKFSFDGKIDSDLLGKFISFNEGGISRLIFVTKRSYNPISRDTSIEGLVGSHTNALTDSPIAIVDGDILYLDTGATGLTDIWASGMRSYSPVGLPLTYSWVQDPDGTPVVVSTDPVLILTDLSTGEYTFELTVDDGTNTGSVRHVLFIGDDADAGSSDYTEEAQIVAGPHISIRANGDVYLTLSSAKPLTQDLLSIDVETSLVSSGGPWDVVVSSPYNNPITVEQLIFSGLAEDANLWIKINLLNRGDGSTSANEYVYSLTNILGGDIDSVTVGTLLAVTGDMTYDALAGSSASFKVATQEYLLISDTGVLFDLAATDTFEVNNSTAQVLEISDTGTKFTQLNGESFSVFNDLNSKTYFNIDDDGVAFGDIILTDFFKITHNGRNKFNIDANGIWMDIDTGDLFRWAINAVESMRIQASEVLFSVELKMGTKNITGVGTLTASGAIRSTAGDVRGLTVSADNGVAAFGPAAPASITIVKGIVTAIS